MKDLSSLDLEYLYEILHKVENAIWRKEHYFLTQLGISPNWGNRGLDAKKIVDFLRERGFNVSKEIVYNYLRRYDRGEITTLTVLEHILRVASNDATVTIEREHYYFRPTYGDARSRVETTIHEIDKGLASLFFEYMLERNTLELPLILVERLPEARYEFKETERGPSWIEGKKVYSDLRLPAIEINFQESVTGTDWRLKLSCHFVLP